MNGDLIMKKPTFDEYCKFIAENPIYTENSAEEVKKDIWNQSVFHELCQTWDDDIEFIEWLKKIRMGD
jgi:hypothetical protein